MFRQKIPTEEAIICRCFSLFTVVRNGRPRLHVVNICKEMVLVVLDSLSFETASDYGSTRAVHGTRLGSCGRACVCTCEGIAIPPS